MPLLYPAPAPTLSGDALTINRFLNSPGVLTRRLRTLAEQRYIADALLTVPVQVEGGAVVYETGETIYADRAPKRVAPGGEYPLTTVGTGTASIAATSKWGEDTLVTDEAIKRQKMNPVNRAMQKLVNMNVKTIDALALSAIATAVTATAGAAAAWSTAGTSAQSVITDVLAAVANMRALNEGYEPDTVVTDDLTWANAMAKFIGAGLTPRESSQTPLLTGQFPVILGLRWLSTPNLPTAGTALVLDSTQLGGMADEQLGGPGYVSQQQPGIEGKTIRDDDNDQWRLRARRVTVPIVQNPAAARKITGV